MPTDSTRSATLQSGGPGPIAGDVQLPGKESTSRYWRGLRTVLRRTKSSINLLNQEMTSASMIASLNKTATVLTEAATDIKALSVLNVSKNATAFAAKQCSALRRVVLDDRHGHLDGRSGSLRKKRTFIAQGLDVFVRSYLGDPLPFKDFDKSRNSLEQRRQSLLTRWQQIRETGAYELTEEVNVVVRWWQPTNVSSAISTRSNLNRNELILHRTSPRSDPILWKFE